MADPTRTEFTVGEGANKVTVIVIDSGGVDVEQSNDKPADAPEEKQLGPYDQITITANNSLIDIKDSTGLSIYRSDGESDDEDEEEEETCGFCKFMKGGECKATFVEWEKCVDRGRSDDKDFVEECMEATKDLRACMEANADYYGPLLEAEKEELGRVQEEQEGGSS